MIVAMETVSAIKNMPGATLIGGVFAPPSNWYASSLVS
jgi:hypothetical protein